MAAYGLYTHISSNKTRSAFLLGGLFVLVYVMVFAGALIAEALTSPGLAIGDYLALAFRDLICASPFATIGAGLWIAIAYRFNGAIIDLTTGARGVTRQEQPKLYNLLENLCISRGIAMPKLKILQTDALNAYATGLNERQYSITVTTGLLGALTDDEIEAVLAHELTHIRNGDVRLMIIAVVIAGVVGFVAELMFRMFLNSRWRMGRSGGRQSSSGNNDSKGAGGAIIAIIIAAVLIVMAWFLSQIIRFTLSRSREYLADAGAVELTKNPDSMIYALRKIEGRGELPNSTSSVMEMCVDNPDSGFVDLFSTHPTVEKRVQALVRFAGGRDPGPLALPLPPDEASAAEGGEAAENEQKNANPGRNPWPLPGPFPGGSSQGPFQGPWGPR